jgi:hypothetical protein
MPELDACPPNCECELCEEERGPCCECCGERDESVTYQGDGQFCADCPEGFACRHHDDPTVCSQCGQHDLGGGTSGLVCWRDAHGCALCVGCNDDADAEKAAQHELQTELEREGLSDV